MIDKSATIYISGPMTGYPEYNYPAFINAEERLRGLGYSNIINPAKLAEQGTDWQTCMRRAVTALMAADAVILLPGWDRSKGAKIEYYLAANLGLSVKSYKSLVSS